MNDDDNNNNKNMEEGPGGGASAVADSEPPTPKEDRGEIRPRRVSLLRHTEESTTNRRDHMKSLLLKEKIRSSMLNKVMFGKPSTPTDLSVVEEGGSSLLTLGADRDSQLINELREEVEREPASTKIQELQEFLEKHGVNLDSIGEQPLEVRMKSFGYSVLVRPNSDQIATVYNQSMLYSIVTFFQRLVKGEDLFPRGETRKTILENINLVFKPGKSYLLLGPPGSGKSTLLKAITGLIRPTSDDDIVGSISYNGRTLKTKGEFYIENAFAYIDQLDKHSPRLTVGETFEFSYNCKKPPEPALSNDGQAKNHSKNRTRDFFLECLSMSLGLLGVKSTFVGDTNVRGVSGGQRRRVTVGEMLTSRASVLCGDEISTGLDASSTFDMVQAILYVARFSKSCRIISLLQPSPETVSLFDEVIVLAEGKIMYAGPVKMVEEYFADIGYICPRFTDTADFLQMVSTDDGSSLYKGTGTVPTVAELAKAFQESELGQRIHEKLELPHNYLWKKDDNVSQHNTSQVMSSAISEKVSRKYSNNFFYSAWLLLKRFVLLWTRDRRVIIAAAVKNVIMGLSVGGCYMNTENVISIQGALFQAGLFIILGAMQSASSLITDRVIYYKHTDANFYSAWPFTFGRAMSQLPQTTIDTIMFATILYFMVGLAGRESASNFFVYLSLLWVFAILMSQQLAFFASFASAGSLQAFSACLVLLLILFCGFIIVPSTIPGYFVWLYWWNPFAWIYRALVVNEFYSARWPDPEAILSNSGFIAPNGSPYGQEWVAYAYAFAIPYSILCTVSTALSLTYIRSEGGTGVGGSEKADDSSMLSEDEREAKTIEIPFTPVTLSFQDVCYDVTASTSKETLRLLNNVNGIFRAGRMCALMGTSGAGKTTLMDVIALRKRSGTISGKILLNGFPQAALSFRRCSGYVEQFDVQSPELTVRETIHFSAKLRLDPTLVTSDEDIEIFVDQVMDHVELSNLRDVPVGTDEGVGLSFEQKKRLSIAVELAASPSVIFLDEPTSGLDSRSALLVVKTLRKISDGGRTVCATIHQPSSSVFGMFDDLLLLKKGGHVVFHGELGKDNCSHLVSYFEARGAQPIETGDNPANWMLRVMDSSSVGDLSEVYLHSEDYTSLKKELERIEDSKDSNSEIRFDSEFATSGGKRRSEINHRLSLIYWRSPSYNNARLLVSVVISFVLGASFITNRKPDTFTENDMRSRVSVIFLTFIITGIMSILSVLPVMTWIRDMFYRHRDAGMYDSASMGLALGVAEKPFIIVSTILFTVVFLATSGMLPANESPLRIFERCVGFWGFFTFNFAIYSYFGQLFVCLVKPLATAIILSSVFIGLNNFFSGLVVRPQFMIGTFYVFPYYITPGMYVYNGLVTVLYSSNNSTVIPDGGSEFYTYLVNNTLCDPADCDGTAGEYVDYFFGGQFGKQYTLRNALVLGLFLIVSRLFTWIALKYIRFSD